MSEDKPHARRLKWFVIALIGVVVLCVGSVLHLKRQVPPPPMPRPNGQHYFAVACKFVGMRPRGYKTMTVDELRGLLQTNATALQLVQTGLNYHSKIDHPYDPDYLGMRMSENMKFRDIQGTMNAAVRLATMESRYSEAAQHGIDIVRFSHESERGGVLIDKLVGLAMESNGYDALRGLTNSLTTDDCKHVAQCLSRVDAEQESLKETMQNEELGQREPLPGECASKPGFRHWAHSVAIWMAACREKSKT